MIIYNVTLKVDERIAGEWLQWVLDEHIPEMLNTGCFTDYKLVRLLEVDDTDGPTYAIQFHARSRDDYNRYLEMYASDINKRSHEKWREGFIAFRSLMEVVK